MVKSFSATVFQPIRNALKQQFPEVWLSFLIVIVLYEFLSEKHKDRKQRCSQKMYTCIVIPPRPQIGVLFICFTCLFSLT